MISRLFISRPVLATVMSLAILLFGVISFTRLPVREYPDIDPPIVSVTTLYRGASPSVVETEITDILEEQFATLEGVKTITSSSQEQGSVITIEFELQRNVEEAANDVRDRVSRTLGSLPREADDPIVEKVDTNAQPIFWIALSSDRHSTLEFRRSFGREPRSRTMRKRQTCPTAVDSGALMTQREIRVKPETTEKAEVSRRSGQLRPHASFRARKRPPGRGGLSDRCVAPSLTRRPAGRPRPRQRPSPPHPPSGRR